MGSLEQNNPEMTSRRTPWTTLSPDEEPHCGDACMIGDAAQKQFAFGGSGADTPEVDPRYPSNSGIIGAQEMGGPPGIGMARRAALAIVAAEDRRSRAALRAINDTNRKHWGG